MRKLNRISLRSITLASFVFLLPAAAIAGGGAGAPAPHPVRDVKVWTNEDVMALGPRFETTAAPAAPVAQATTTAVSAPAAAPIAPGQGPQWYAEQLTALENELATVSGREQYLRNFRASGTAVGTGMNVVAPCEGVGTDNLIAQLAARRMEISREIDALGDTARINGMAPGILVAGRGRANLTAPTAAQRQQSLEERSRSVSEELAQTETTLAAALAEATAKGITLAEPNSRWGGNMTTNMLQGLYNRRGALQSEAAAIQEQRAIQAASR